MPSQDESSGLPSKVLEYLKAMDDPDPDTRIMAAYGLTDYCRGAAKFLKESGKHPHWNPVAEALFRAWQQEEHSLVSQRMSEALVYLRSEQYDEWLRKNCEYDTSVEDRLLMLEGKVLPVEEHIKQVFSHLPKAAEQRLGAVAERIDAFRQEAIHHLGNALNAYLGEMAQAQRPGGDVKRKSDDMLIYEKKQEIVETVNSNLDRLGLAIGYQGQNCYMATLGGGTPHGRFLIVPKGSKSPLLARVNLADFLPLTLVDASPRREGLPEWREREQARRNAANPIARRE